MAVLQLLYVCVYNSMIGSVFKFYSKDDYHVQYEYFLFFSTVFSHWNNYLSKVTEKTTDAVSMGIYFE